MGALHNNRLSVYLQIYVIIFQINRWISNSFQQTLIYLDISKIILKWEFN
jgi:hypothetical protein